MIVYLFNLIINFIFYLKNLYLYFFRILIFFNLIIIQYFLVNQINLSIFLLFLPLDLDLDLDLDFIDSSATIKDGV